MGAQTRVDIVGMIRLSRLQPVQKVAIDVPSSVHTHRQRSLVCRLVSLTIDALHSCLLGCRQNERLSSHLRNAFDYIDLPNELQRFSCIGSLLSLMHTTAAVASISHLHHAANRGARRRVRAPGLPCGRDQEEGERPRQGEAAHQRRACETPTPHPRESRTTVVLL